MNCHPGIAGVLSAPGIADVSSALRTTSWTSKAFQVSLAVEDLWMESSSCSFLFCQLSCQESMHELPFTQSLLELALRHAQQAHAQRITDLYIVLGELSSFVDDSIQFYWDTIAEGTIAQGARLHFRRVPAELQCMACFTKYTPQQGELLCPNCGSVGAKILAGEECFLEAIDIE